MATKLKRTRLATKKDYENGSVEYVEQDVIGTLYWTAKDNELNMEASIPVDVVFVHEFFGSIGRVFDVSLLPSNTIRNPYAFA